MIILIKLVQRVIHLSSPSIWPDEDDAVLLLRKTLSEEKEADTLLTKAAYNTINFDADNEDQKQK